MNPGTLDRRITLLTRTVVVDSAGAPVETWAISRPPLWAGRVANSGNESQQAGTTRATNGETLRIRWLETLNTPAAPGTYRVRHNGRDWNLGAAIEDTSQPRRTYMLLSLSFTQGEPTLTAVPALP